MKIVKALRRLTSKKETPETNVSDVSLCLAYHFDTKIPGVENYSCWSKIHYGGRKFIMVVELVFLLTVKHIFWFNQF